MADYSGYPLQEASNEQVVIQFVQSIKELDEKVSIKRLCGLLMTNTDFVEVSARFVSLVGHKTCMDDLT